MLSNEDGGDDGLRSINNDGINLEEGSGDLEENSIPNFVDDMSNMVICFNVANSSSNHSFGKRKATQYLTPQGRKRRVLKWKHNYFHVWIDWLITFQKKSDCTSTSRDRKGCSIEKVIKKVHSIDGVHFGSELHIFAIDFFYLISKREI